MGDASVPPTLARAAEQCRFNLEIVRFKLFFFSRKRCFRDFQYIFDITKMRKADYTDLLWRCKKTRNDVGS